MSKNIAISVKGVSKTFKIPHEKVSSLRGAFTAGVRSLFSASPSRRGTLRGCPPDQSFEDEGNSPRRGLPLRNRGGFETFRALDNVSFEVKKGEFFGIIGRNGSGKSTLLKILAHIYQPDKGSVKINGMISPFLELGIGFNPELSGRDNVYLNATVLGMTKKQIDEKFDSIVAFSELERFIDQKLKNYSSGMQVRLAFSVSIHANRDILLMDEVLAVGDSNFQSKCLEEFKKIVSQGKTIILVTHSMEYVEKFCDRVALISEGNLRFCGSPQKAITEYQKIDAKDINRKLAKKNKQEKEEDTFSYRTGNGRARIQDYHLFDHNKNESYVFETGKFFSVSFKVVAITNLIDVSVAVILREGFNSNLLAVHSTHRMKPVYIKKLEQGQSVIVLVKDVPIPVNPGKYYITISCATHRTETEYEVLDTMENAIEVVIIGDQKYFGIINTNNVSLEIFKENSK